MRGINKYRSWLLTCICAMMMSVSAVTPAQASSIIEEVPEESVIEEMQQTSEVLADAEDTEEPAGDEEKEEETVILPLLEGMVVSVGDKGFNPSKNNYLRIKASIPYEYWNKMDVRIRIYNSKGKYVYQKILKDIGPEWSNELGYMVDISWNGKPSKKNQAGLSTSKYVGKGTYTAEVSAYYQYFGDVECISRTVSFKVSTKAKSGYAGVAEAKTAPILTGHPDIDYMAELMVKAAGVKSTMSDDAKVKAIYHWMTRNFMHKHYDSMKADDKQYYNLDQLSSKINSYRKKCLSKVKKGSMIFSFKNTGECSNMVYRYGVCDDNAAVFSILCNHAGVEAGLCSGYYLNRNGSAAGHTWNYAIIDGKKYYYDIDVEIQNYGKGQGDYYWYKKTKSQAKKNHEFYYEE